jgi:uroporphyrinogen-III decarboxylase
MTMTNRERVTRTLQCLRVDRPPFVIWLGFYPWPATMNRWRRESGIADLDLTAYFGFGELEVTAPLEYGAYPHFPESVLEETPTYTLTADYRGLVVRGARDENAMMEFVSHPVKCAEDWKRYKEERLQPRIEERIAPLEPFLEKTRNTDAPLLIGGYPWGVFGTVREMLGAVRTLLSFCDEPDMVRDIMETYVTLWLSLYERVAQRVQIDHIHIWEDMSGKQGSLISMAMVEDFMMPQYDRIAVFAREHNVPVLSVDSDGKVDELLPVMVRHGVNVFLPFEAQAGNDIEEVRRQFPKLGILGGLDKNALARGKPEIHVQLDRAQRMFASGGYVAGFDHSIPPNVPWENYRYFVDNLKRLIGI